MDILGFLLLMLSVSLSAGRNILSKGVSAAKIGTKGFFLLQLCIFGSGSIVMLFLSLNSSGQLSLITLLYALLYGALLLSAQWCYTAALKNGKTAICSTVYSLGFILPTLSGAIFWNEHMGVWKIIGIILVIPAIIISGLSSKKDSGSEKAKNTYILPLLISMLSSGGLGIMQKVQQSSPFPEQKSIFVLFAFVFAALVSLVCFLLARPDGCRPAPKQPKKLLAAFGVGICFASCNILNTTLAGMLDSAIFFPTLNVGAILLSMLLGIIIYKERLTKKDAVVLLLGLSAVLVINLKV